MVFALSSSYSHMNSMLMKSDPGSTLTGSRRLCSTPRQAIGKKASGVLPHWRDAKRNSKRAFDVRWNTPPCSETSGYT